jgi:hypothetical protein
MAFVIANVNAEARFPGGSETGEDEYLRRAAIPA